MLISSTVGNLYEIQSDRQWTPSEFQRQVQARVSTYSRLGLSATDRTLILFGNRLEFFAELAAIWSLGGCAIPVDSRLTAYEMRKLANAANAKFAIADDATNPHLTEALSDSIVVNTMEHSFPPTTPLQGFQYQLDSDALILFTSGSTGRPKGVVHTHRSLLARWTSLRQSLGLSAFERTLCVLPTHFGHGLICNCLFPWLFGCDLYIGQPFTPQFIMQLGSILDEHRITFISSVPSLWNLALRASNEPRSNSLKQIHVGSAPLSSSLWRQIQEWSGIRHVFNAYGITETGSWVAGTNSGAVEPADGLIGQAWGSTIRIMTARNVDTLKSNCEACVVGEEGMIWLKTPALMKGYFRSPELTEEVVCNGWFMTGDIGLVDDSGQLFIRGRERDEINKGGMKVFPADIDAVVADHASVIDSCAFAIDDPFYGENVALAVVLTDSSVHAIQSLYQWLTSCLAEHKRPTRLYIVDEIPRTERGKINRDNVRSSCMEREPTDLRALAPDNNPDV